MTPFLPRLDRWTFTAVRVVPSACAMPAEVIVGSRRSRATIACSRSVNAIFISLKEPYSDKQHLRRGRAPARWRAPARFGSVDQVVRRIRGWRAAGRPVTIARVVGIRGISGQVGTPLAGFAPGESPAGLLLSRAVGAHLAVPGAR